MVTSSRQWVIAALALAAIGLSLGGCQKAVDVGAVNPCGVDAETLYVKVRVPGGQEIRTFDLPMTSLGKPPADADYEAQLVLEGNRCPSR